MSKRALLVGIDIYETSGNDLNFAVSDAEAMAQLLSRHEDGTPNYECRMLLDSMEDGREITRANLRQACEDLFTDFTGQILLYFSGHGVLTPFGGHLCTWDATQNDWGVPMQEIMQLALESKAQDILLILDCCHSGSMANPSMFNNKNSNPLALLRENMTVIAASRASEVSVEAGGHGLFTAAVLDALEGGAADHMGWVTAPSIYAYVERRFGAWSQRPVYKSHATELTVVRECAPLIDRLKLRELVSYFPTVNYQYQLDPEFEPEDEHGNRHEPVNQEKINIAQLFKDYRDAGLLKPSTPNEQLFWTARRSHTVELTNRGREYWTLVKGGKI
jgi:hypothetical protein